MMDNVTTRRTSGSGVSAGHSIGMLPSTAMTERRFNEEEVAAIFAKAAEVQQSGQGQLTRSPRDGITLADLEAIGHEVGIAPEILRQAAASIDREDKRTTRRFLGFPIGVG